MAPKAHQAKEIVATLAQIDMLLRQGRLVAEVIRMMARAFTCCRWRKEFGA